MSVYVAGLVRGNAPVLKSQIISFVIDFSAGSTFRASCNAAEHVSDDRYDSREEQTGLEMLQECRNNFLPEFTESAAVSNREYYD